MRILYGAHTQGQGGLAKAAVLAPLLEALGHEVCVVTTGRPVPASFRYRLHYHFPGLEYVVAHGQTDYLRTFLRWLKQVPQVMSTLGKVRALCRNFQPELVISDFEPLTAHPLLKPGCEVLAVSRPLALVDSGIPLPEEDDFERRITRTTIRLFTAGADRRFGYHLEPTTYRCLPPVIGQDLQPLSPTQGNHLVVYNVYHTGEGRAADLVAWARRCRQPVIAYGFPEVARKERVGLVDFKAPSREQFLRDLATCRAVITTAGMSLPVEAFRLGKPVNVVPIPRQWEQAVNAFHLQQAGLARWLPTWDYSAALDTAPPPSPLPADTWLQRGALYVLRRLLPPGAIPETLLAPRVAA